MKSIWVAAVACVAGFAGVSVDAAGVCDIHRLGYTKAQCDECSNMKWEVTRAFPKGACVAVAAAARAPVNAGVQKPAPAAAAPKTVCDIHHLGYTKAECDKCSNMSWNVTKVTPQGQCASTAPPQTINIGGKGSTPAPTPPKPTTAAASCTLTNWGGATLPLNAPNFSGTGVKLTVCSKGYDLAKSQLHCSTGVPATAFNAPTTNVTCNKTTGVGGNTQVTINGKPCCLN